MATPNPRQRAAALAQGLAGRYLWRPWFDRLALSLMINGYSPLSRIWATGLECDTPSALRDALPQLSAGPPLNAAFATLHRRAGAYRAAEAVWESALFEGQGDAAMAQTRRLATAQRFTHARIPFGAVPGWWRVPAVRYEISDAAAVLAAHGARLARPDAFPFAATKVQQSRVIDQAGRRTYWLRFPSTLGDTAWAKVVEPAGVIDPPTLISLHGIAIESEMMVGVPDPFGALVGQGVRVIYPEGPWHGRRRPHGWSAGEPVMGRAPLGMLDLLAGWVGEVAVLSDWARRQGSARIGLAGTSLGALTAQRAAAASRHWPAGLQPDVLLLVTTSGDMLDVTLRGDLARGLKVDAALAGAGWTSEALQPWRPLLEPGDTPPLNPADIMMVLGEADRVTPYAGGVALAKVWGLPDTNIFRRPRGHFSAAAAMPGEHEILAALARRLIKAAA